MMLESNNDRHLAVWCANLARRYFREEKHENWMKTEQVPMLRGASSLQIWLP